MLRLVLGSLVLALLSACQGDDGSQDSAAAGDARPTGERAAAAAPAPSAPQVDFSPRLDVIEETIAYGESTDHNLTGMLALPADSFEPPPGVLLIHEWRGLDDSTRMLARRIAGEGFVVLAIDLYDGEVAESTTQAQGLMTRVMTDPEQALDNIRQGIEYLRLYALAPRVAAVGWSFGGTWSLQAGLSHAEQLDAVVMYYGQIATEDTELERLRSPLLGLFAGDDESISSQSVVGFRAALASAGKNADIRIYPDERHEFATPGSENYGADSAEDAWSRMVEFLNQYLR